MSQLSNGVSNVSFRLLQEKNHHLEEKIWKKHPGEPFDMRVSNFETLGKPQKLWKRFLAVSSDLFGLCNADSESATKTWP